MLATDRRSAKQPAVAEPAGWRRVVHRGRALLARLMRRVGHRRLLLWTSLGASVVAIGLGIMYPRLGEWAIRNRVVPRLEKRLGQKIHIEDIDVSLGHATLRHLQAHSATGQTVGKIERIDLDFSFWRSLVGSIRLNSATLTHTDISVTEAQFEQLRDSWLPRTTRTDLAATSKATAGLRALLPTQITIDGLTIAVNHRGRLAIGSLGYDQATHEARLRDVSATAMWRGQAITLAVPTAMVNHASIATFENATMTAPWVRVAHMAGTLLRNGDVAAFDVHGDYPSSASVGWHAQGNISSDGRNGFATVSTKVGSAIPQRIAVAMSAQEIKFSGAMTFAGLRIDHRAVSTSAITDVGFTVDVKGSYHRAARVFEIPVATIHKDQVDVAIAGTMHLAAPGSIDVRLTVPPVPCQTALAALPPQLIPALAGYQLAGTFALELRGAIRRDALAASTLESTGGLAGCSVVAAPRNSPTKLNAAFSHRVEIAPHVYSDFIVGGVNPAFVEFDRIPDYVISSLIETEDPSFMEREHFAAPGMARALLENLRTGSLRIGGSTIPMQVAKNVFLDGKRNISRKMQELLLAWHIESTLPRYRILEIYFNIIEFGPGIYGVGNATRELFDKPIHELMPVDAAYFSAIIPRPRFSYQNFCTSKIDEPTLTRMQRALTLLVNEGKISVEDWDAATSTPIVFAARKGTQAECMERRRQALTMFESH